MAKYSKYKIVWKSYFFGNTIVEYSNNQREAVNMALDNGGIVYKRVKNKWVRSYN